MKHLRSVAALAACVQLAACTDYATFVTSTDIGISADATTQDLHIGYVRTELFTGPGYPEYGAAPAAVGYLGSNLSAFTPKIKQLYATGDAAEIVTRGKQPNPNPSEKPEELAGLRRPLVFGTGSNLGLQVSFAGGAPSKVKFGYNREELSIIPLRQQAPIPGYPDKYASVLASINMDQSLTNQANSAVKLTQFFATGPAAKNLARQDKIQAVFEEQAKEAITKVTEKYSYDDLSRKIEAYWKPNGKVDSEHANKIRSCMAENQIEGNEYEIVRTKTQEEKEKVIKCLPI